VYSAKTICVCNVYNSSTMEEHPDSVSARVSRGTARRIKKNVDNADKSKSDIVRELIQHGFTGRQLQTNLRNLLLYDADAVGKMFDCVRSIEEDNSEVPENITGFFKDAIKESFEGFDELEYIDLEEMEPDEKRAVLSVKEGIATDEEFEIFLDVAKREVQRT